MHIKQKSQLFGWALLAVAFIAGCFTIYHEKYVDEADILVVGWMIRQGAVLYRDVFSHHFPFPYYWAALAILLFGKSIFAIRLSLWAFEISAFGIALKFSRFHLAMGFFALIWSLIRYLYLGNMLLYHSFTGTALIVVFVMVFSILQKKIEPGFNSHLIIGVFTTIALLSDPFTIYPLAVAGILLLIAHTQAGLKTGLVILAFLIIFLLYLLISGTALDFWNSAILFNTNIYNAYKPVNVFNISGLYHNLVSGLDIANPVWYKFKPFRDVGENFNTWFFSGFLYRFSLLAGVILFLLRRNFKASILIYLTGGILLLNGDEPMRMIGFVMLSLMILCVILTNEAGNHLQGRWVKFIEIPLRIFLGLMIFWLGLRVSLTLYEKQADFSDAALARLAWKGDLIRQEACNRNDVLLADFPNGIYSYWFSGYAPATKYLFLWPWVAEVGQNDIIDTLERNREKPILVYMNDMKVWNRYSTKQYLSALYDYLDQNFNQVEDGIYKSPVLFKSCPVPTSN